MRGMKRVFAVLLALCLFLLCAGCGSTEETSPSSQDKETKAPPSTSETEAPTKPSAAQMQDKNDIPDMATYQVTNVYESNDVAPPNPGRFYAHYQAETGKKYIVVLMDVTNRQSGSIRIDKLIAASLEIDGTKYDATTVLKEKNNGAELESYDSLDALETGRLYYLFSVPQNASTDAMQLTVQAGEDLRTMSIDLSDFTSKVTPVKLGAEITDGETVSLSVESVYFSSTLYPPFVSGYYSYHYYEAPSGKTFLIVKVNVKNLKGSDLKYDSIAGVTCVYQEKYSYSSYTVFEEDGGADLNNYPSLYSIAPLDTGVVYYMMEVPQEVENGPVVVNIYAAGDYYAYNIG